MDYYHGSIIPHLTELLPFEGKENNLKSRISGDYGIDTVPYVRFAEVTA